MKKHDGMNFLGSSRWMLVMFALLGSACGTKTGTARVQLDNSAVLQSNILKGTGAAASLTTVQFGAKLAGVDLVQDMANGSPVLDVDGEPDPDIFVHPDCNGDIAGCESRLNSYFELIDPTAANAVLNSQGRSVEVGTYKYVRLYFLIHDGGVNNIMCNDVPKSYGLYVPIVVQLAQPLTIESGDVVTVSLSYNPTGVDCTDGGQVATMFYNMTATATKN